MKPGTVPPVADRRNPEALARFVEAHAVTRRSAICVGRALLEIDRCGHFGFEQCASIGEFGELHGASATEARSLVALARAIEMCPVLEGMVLEGRVSLQSASLLDRVLGHPELLRDGDDWLGWAETETARQLRRRIDRRVEETRMGGGPAVAMTVFVSPKGRDAFDRARVIASRKADCALTAGQTLETVVDHYLDSFDPERRGAGSRRLPHTSTVRGRYVPAAVERQLRARDGDRCALPFCDHDVFLENAHLMAHAAGGHREADNLVRLCSKHHKMLDEGRLKVTGSADAPIFTDADGHPLDGKRAGRARRVDSGGVDPAPT